MAYIRGEKKPVEGCIFCSLGQAADSPQIIARSEHVYVTINLYPYNNGHLMVIPYEHVDTPEKLDTAVLTDLTLTANKCLSVLRAHYRAPAFNTGANIGGAAGAGIAEHYHFHIVPRWPGDANFMTVVGETRVIPDTVENAARELRAVWEQVYGAEES
jgi:ATP adenylyltransferase